MRKYKLLKENDILPDHKYLAIVYYPYPSPNRNAMTEWVYYDSYKQWGGTRNDIVEIVDESIISVLIEENPQRAYEIIEGGFKEDEIHQKLLKSYDFHLMERISDLLSGTHHIRKVVRNDKENPIL